MAERLAALAALCFLVAVPWGGGVVRLLLARGIGKRIRDDEPDAHQAKMGTATMGGLYFLAGTVAVGLALALAGRAEALLPLAAMVGYGALGAYDDLVGLKAGGAEGWLARSKMLWQWGLALVLSVLCYVAVGREAVVHWPLSAATARMGLWLVPLSMLALVGSSNAANFADGMDGLAGGTAVTAYAAYALLSWAEGHEGLALFSAAVVGFVLAFLWHNVHPARLFMGDTGSQALGAGLATLAVLSGHWPLLPLIAAVWVAEALSVMVQVGWFKWTRRRHGEGRRVLRMAPLHYHFELGGWAEVQVTLRFWLAAAFVALLGLALGLAR